MDISRFPGDFVYPVKRCNTGVATKRPCHTSYGSDANKVHGLTMDEIQNIQDIIALMRAHGLLTPLKYFARTEWLHNHYTVPRA